MPNRDRDPLTGIPPSRHPFQVWILAACLISGISTAVFDAGPATLRELLPVWAFWLWGAVLMMGGFFGLLGAFWEDRITGLLMERLALIAISGGSMVYAVTVVSLAGKVGYTTAAYTMSVGIAGFWRVRHINRALRVLSRWMDQHYDWGGD